MPSAQPVMYSALLTMFARKKRVPIDPPNSGPNVRLIMTEVVKLRVSKKDNLYLLQLKRFHNTLSEIQFLLHGVNIMPPLYFKCDFKP
jgi:hypothetical protein